MGRWQMIGTGWLMRSSTTRTISSRLRDLSSRRRHSRHYMIPHWQDIRVLPKPTGPLGRGSHGRASRRAYSSTSRSVMFARGTRER